MAMGGVRNREESREEEKKEKREKKVRGNWKVFRQMRGTVGREEKI